MSDDKKHQFPKRISTVEVGPEVDRMSTGISGLDACLAESDDGPQGLPRGTSMLLSGMPGGGKSTISTHMAAMAGSETLILHGEERDTSVRKRWDRLGLPKGCDPWLFPLRAVEDALTVIRELGSTHPLGRVIVDSVQTLTLGGKRKYDDQYEAIEMLVGQVCSTGGDLIAVSHVSKTGTDHAGAAALAHLVDIHLHVTTNAKKMERVLEVRKNRHGRAGFQVPLNITLSGISVGVPAALSANGSMAGARKNLEGAIEIVMGMLMEGKRVDGYDYAATVITNGGMWRAGLDIATKRLVADGYEIIEDKVKQRRGYRMANPPNLIVKEPAAVVVPKIEIIDSINLEMT